MLIFLSGQEQQILLQFLSAEKTSIDKHEKSDFSKSCRGEWAAGACGGGAVPAFSRQLEGGSG